MTNRRNFVKQAAAVMAMAAMPGVIQSASEEREKGLTLKRSQIKVDDQWDVIIVGGGPAGCTVSTTGTPTTAADSTRSKTAT